MQKFISWNVNGLRAILQKGFSEYFLNSGADIFALQETKLRDEHSAFDPEGYFSFWNCAVKKGYAGTAVFTKKKPVSVIYGMGIDEHDKEGRIITLEFNDYYFMNVYTPNSQRELVRLDYRMKWEDDFREFTSRLKSKKPVVFCGDLNVAHKEIDLKNPSSNRKNAGFTDQERDKFTKLLDSGFTDTFRHFFPDATGAYSWWSYMFNARQNNVGWRIDYFCTSRDLNGRLKGASIHPEIFGSDHCPVELVIDL